MNIKKKWWTPCSFILLPSLNFISINCTNALTDILISAKVNKVKKTIKGCAKTDGEFGGRNVEVEEMEHCISGKTAKIFPSI